MHGRGAFGPHEGDWPYLWIDATYVKTREAGRIVSVAVIVAVGVMTSRSSSVLRGRLIASSLWPISVVTLTERHLRLQLDGDASAAVDVGLFQRAVSNLLSNATRYATPDSTIEVSLRPDGQYVRVAVMNRGVEISQEQFPLIFNRFHQVEPSRGDEAHHGLGLAIVAAIARMHDGSTFARSAGGQTSVGMLIRARDLHPVST